jgi:hypothetical protein
MSELDDAMLQRMIHIVHEDHKPFSYFDFVDIMKPKTYRIKISLLKKEGIVESDIRSSIALHTLKGNKFGKPGTPTHTVVFPHSHSHRYDISISHYDPLYKTLANLPFGAESIHDIRSRFHVPQIYNSLNSSCGWSVNDHFNLARNSNSGDIVVPSFSKDNAIVRIIVHKTDVVSVIIGCSKEPIPLDPEGLIRFSTLLTRAEDKLQSILDFHYQYYNPTTCFPSPVPVSEAAVVSPLPPTAVNCSIPDYKSWLITMWHFGRDALVEYNGEKFSRTIEDAQHILTRIYSKEFGNGKGKRKHRRIRKETQEYPNITVEDAIEEKLNQDV